MNAVDPYTRHCVKVAVAQICQVIGWTSIHSTPLEILTDLLQEYIVSLARMTKNYATLYGMNTPGVQHVGLALKTMGVSFNDLTEYMSAVEVPPVNDVPLYPIKRIDHLNFLKPGSREVVTRPVHIHEHLPPVHPEMQDEDIKEVVPVDVPPVAADTSGHVNPANSPKGVFKKPGDPDNLFRRQRIPMDQEEVRALREITSVMMTTSGFLSPAREGKLPEARTPQTNQNQIPCTPVVNEKPEPINTTVLQKFLQKERKRKKPKEGKINKDNVQEPEKLNKINKEQKSKMNKLTKLVDNRSPSPNQKSGPLNNSGSLNNSIVHKSNLPRKQQIITSAQNPLINKPTRPVINVQDKFVKPDSVQQQDEVKLPSELDKHKLNIFKKISKVKDETELANETKEVEPEKWSGLDEVIDAVSRGTIEIKEDLDSVIKEEPELHIDVVSVPVNKENIQEINVNHVVEPPPRPPEFKKKKKDKLKEKNLESRYTNNTNITSVHQEQNIVLSTTNHENETTTKSTTSSSTTTTTTNKQISSSTLDEPFIAPTKANLPPHLTFPTPSDFQFQRVTSPNLGAPFGYFPFPSGVLDHPLIPQGPPVLGPYPGIPPPSIEPINQIRGVSSTTQETVAPPPALPPIMGPPISSSVPVTPTTSPKKKEHKKIKKLKDKLKKKKGKKEKNRAKIKSEKKRLKLEKKEREKEKIKSKKEKKEKKKEKLESTEDKQESQNVPKITLKFSPVSTQDSPTETCHRKIVIKPVVKKDEEKDDLWSSTNLSSILPTSSSSKSHKAQKKNSLTTNNNIIQEEEPKVVPPSVAHAIQSTTASTTENQSEYICPACNRPDDGSPMIACDSCDLWFHWICVGIQEPPESDWYCRRCTIKMDLLSSEKRKKHKKKKSAA